MLGVCSTLGPIPGVDLWWQMAAGKIIWTTGAVPTTDPFSYTARGHPWLVHEWAADLLFYLIYTRLGPTWLVALKVLVEGTALLITLLLALRWSSSPWLAAICAGMAAVGGRYFWDIRPQMFSYLFLAVLLVLVDDFRSRGKVWPLWVIPLLMLLWANLHGGFLLAPLVLLAYLFGDSVDYLLRRNLVRKDSYLLAIPLVAGSLLALLNPNGYHLWLYPLKLTGHPQVLGFVMEWLSPDFHDPNYRLFELIALLLVPAMAWSKRQQPTAHLILAIASLHFALFSVRHVPIFLLIATPILAGALGEALHAAAPQAARSPLQSVTAGVLLAALGLIQVRPVLGKRLFEYEIDMRSFPVRAVAFMKRAKLPGPIWNEYRWGGYLIWHAPEYPVFIDGRAEVYYGGPFEDFVQMHRVKPNWEALMFRYGVRTALVDNRMMIARVMERSPYWRIAYRDSGATLFVRNEAVRTPPISTDAIQRRHRAGK